MKRQRHTTRRIFDRLVEEKGFEGFVHTDGYCGYSKLTGVTKCRCWAHLPRNFIEVIPSNSLTGKLTNAEIGRDYCDKLFEIERKLKKLLPKIDKISV